MEPSLRRAVARIDAGVGGPQPSRGTGTLIAPDLLLTALHVVANRTSDPPAFYPGRTVLTFPDQTSDVEIIPGLWDRHADWILLRVLTPPAGVRPVPIADPPADGSEWSTFGFPDANPGGMVQTGTLEHRQGDLNGTWALQLFSKQAAAGDGAPVKGLSGGPVIAGGALVGVLRFALMKDSQTVAGTLYGCPIDLVLDRAGDRLPIPDPCRGLPGLPQRPLPAAPVKYLERFTADDAEIFFGRNRDIRDLYERLTAPDGPPVTLLYGQSGVGKSSFLDAGVGPRLQWSHQTLYVRRDRGKGVVRTLVDAVEAKAGQAGEGESSTRLRSAWKAIVAAGQKPLVVFLDQVEELFTTHSQAAGELDELADVLAAVFADRAELAGTLVLGFRKEWFPEIQKQFDACKIDYAKVFLQGLDGAGIIEVSTGLQGTARLRKKYGLTVDAGVPEAIANDLLKDRDSPIAPTLQILLSTLWHRATAGSASEPHITASLYAALEHDGFMLGDFLDQQLAALRTAAAAGEGGLARDVVDSGLALDMLAFHTTAYSTAEERSAADVEAEYAHRRADLPALLEQMKRLFLLTDPGGELASVGGGTRLPHDTLAIVVRARVAQSNLPGQRARRILENRAGEWTGEQVGTPLDGRDLTLAEQGLAGMRTVRPNESRLLDASREARRADVRARRRRRALIYVGAGAVLLAGAVAAWFGLQTRRQLEWRQLLTDDAKIPTMLSIEPVGGLVMAIDTVDRSLRLNNGILPTQVQANLARALGVARERESWSFVAQSTTAVAFAADGRVAAGTSDGLIYMVQVGRREPVFVVRAGSASAPVTSLAFSEDGGFFAAALGPLGTLVWDRQGRPTALPQMPEGLAMAVRFVAKSHTLVATFQPERFAGRTTLYSCDLDRREARATVLQTEDPTQSMALATTSSGDVWVATGGGIARLWTLSGQPLAERRSETPIGDVDLAVTADGTVLLAATDERSMMVWDLTHKTGPVSRPLAVHTGSLTFAGRGQVVVAYGDDGMVRTMTTNGSEPIAPFPASTFARGVVAASADGQSVAVGSAEPNNRANVRLIDLLDVELVSPVRAVPSADGLIRNNALRFASSGSSLFLAAETGLTRWDLDLPLGTASPAVRMTALATGSEVQQMAPGPNGQLLTIAGRIEADGSKSQPIELQLRDASGRTVWTTPIGEWAAALGFSPDGRTAVVGDANGQISIFDVPGRRKTRTLPAHKLDVWAAEFDPSGRYFATTSGDGHLRVWTTTGDAVADVARVNAMALAWHPDGTLYTGGSNGQVEHRRQDGRLILAVPIFRGSDVSSIYVPPTGESVFVASHTRLARVDVASGAVLGVRNSDKDITHLAGSPDGRLLAGTTQDGGVLLLRADWREWLAEACGRLKGHEVFLMRSTTPSCRPDGGARGGEKAETRSLYGANCEAAYQACLTRVWSPKGSGR